MKNLLRRTELFFLKADGDIGRFVKAVSDHLTALKIVVVCCKLLRLSQATLFSSFILFVRMCNSNQVSSRVKAVEIGLCCLMISGKMWERDVTTRQILVSLFQLLGKHELISPSERLLAKQLTPHDLAVTECHVLNAIHFRFDVTFPPWDWIEYFLCRTSDPKPQSIRDQCSKTLWVILKVSSAHNGIHGLLEFYFTTDNVRYFSAAMVCCCETGRSYSLMESKATSVLGLEQHKLRMATAQVRAALSDCISISIPPRPTSRPASSRSSDSKRKRDTSESSHPRMKIPKSALQEIDEHLTCS
eukprot:TRINITY_DN25730_c0_g1_i1.p1 TRINITY_DN25730_c0_g1~~TRINITY_DN25730_c0_g1_i1.p1  ORF type:complete len:302 (+),score=27.91 TRINITY_DN25730_c0_g1_i1:83-988(+)